MQQCFSVTLFNPHVTCDYFYIFIHRNTHPSLPCRRHHHFCRFLPFLSTLNPSFDDQHFIFLKWSIHLRSPFNFCRYWAKCDSISFALSKVTKVTEIFATNLVVQDKNIHRAIKLIPMGYPEMIIYYFIYLSISNNMQNDIAVSISHPVQLTHLPLCSLYALKFKW